MMDSRKRQKGSLLIVTFRSLALHDASFAGISLIFLTFIPGSWSDFA
jgi:hypothetical protein